MNKDVIKTDLLAIIKESKNLPDSELETLAGTNIKIRKGRAREFSRLADNFYELEFNQLISNDTDTITPVYELLEKEVRDEAEEYIVGEAYSAVSEINSELNRFKNLKKSLATVNKAYEMTVRDLNDLYLKRSNTSDWQKNVDEKNSEIKRLSDNSVILKEQLLEAKKNVNESMLEYVEKQMQNIKDSFTHTISSAEKALSVDKETFILASDKEEYDSLYLVSRMLKVANAKDEIEDLVVLEDAMIVTKDQKDVLSSILSKIKLLEYMKKSEKSEEKIIFEEKNALFIKTITDRLRELENNENKKYAQTKSGVRLAPVYREEYNSLLDLLKFVNKANASGRELVAVWDKVYVLGEDRSNFEQLLKNTELFKELNPDFEKKNQNQQLINDLIGYLDELSNKVTKEQGVAYLPIKSTISVGDKAWVVIDRDLEEANRIAEIINLLQEQSNNLVSVWGQANIEYQNITRFKRLANATKYFADFVPNIPENEAELKKVHDALTDLIRKAKETNNPVLASNGLVLESDIEIYKLLEEKYKYLEASKVSENLVSVDGVQIDSKYAKRYHEINERLNEALNPNLNPNQKEIDIVKARIEEIKSDSLAQEELSLLEEKLAYLERGNVSGNTLDINGIKIDVDDALKYEEVVKKLKDLTESETLTGNDLEIKKIKKEIAELEERAKNSKKGKMAENGKVLQKDLKKYDRLQEKLGYLEKAKASKNLVSIDGIQIDKEDVEAYKKVNKKTRSKVLNIRKLGSKSLDFVRKNWKAIIAIGLGAAAALYILPTLIPSIIFANSCNVAAFPWLAGVLNPISSMLASLSGIAYGPGIGLINLGVSAESALSSTLIALSKLGIVGLSIAMPTYGVKKYLDRNKEKQLPDPERKNIAQKIIGLGENLKLDLEKFNKEKRAATPDISETDLISAQIEYEANQENLTGEGLTKEEIIEQIEKEEALAALETKKESAPDLEDKEVIKSNLTQTDLINAQIGYEASHENLTGEGLTEDEIIARQIGDEVSEMLDNKDETISRIEERAAKLADATLEEGALEQVETLDDSPIQIEIPPTGEVLDNLKTTTSDNLEKLRLDKLEDLASYYQKILDETAEPLIRKGYEAEIAKINNEIEGIKGRGL